MAAFRTLRAISAEDAYANLALAEHTDRLDARDAAFATTLVAGTCRALGLYDAIIASAGGRPLSSLQPAVVDLLRLGAHQLLDLRVPAHAAVAATVNLARGAVGQRVTGVVNAILRKVAALDADGWAGRLRDERPDAEALLTRHPQWIIDAFAEVLPAAELPALLEADNAPPTPHLVVRPGLAEVSELGGTPLRWSPFGAVADGNPAELDAVREGRAGVQDEGSQLVAWALTRPDAPVGPWLDLCAGPGGKAALLAGIAAQVGTRLLASELQPHRAALVARALDAYPEPKPVVIAADGTRAAWPAKRFARVMLDAPCSGLGALRRRPEARWRRRPADVDDLVPLQHALLASAIAAARPGGLIAYVTCSPHRRETVEVVEAASGVRILDAASALPEVPDAARGPYLQLWPHRHGTDAMFLALLRKTGPTH
ncbi:RsmB/NOP family class I SAM-dependent RNA methyltransferase [Micropruina sonneratiae]|uniref:RsmB/NOP family class I SAM-dependent RNA methyltransferase n=1 Tax=Micropruina sonneratiae TaxID=2986940 RepID=UPI0022275F52|nr:RsmB/NOP family class I SAM-dependent RNA methyltransferase [Micropruina sp. KQZ13P-5]MCW3157711.1 RsmB/NOP family class I SAM-dependent RNA methyltransferase [Micropruina sp. KQZ13P-5]